MIIFETVVLPDPDSPTSPSVWPAARLNDTSDTAWTIRGFCHSRPARSVKFLLTPSTCRIGPASGAGVWPGGISALAGRIGVSRSPGAISNRGTAWSSARR